ncbi:hypothetical protein [Fibrella aestuarina]|uniref:hypothetical protein n=1 Tax=Fibrella aestuarina TaxID=651143 RepID=UPI00059DD1A3|nr:hypothetical protein [Fibrella aestuarina]
MTEFVIESLKILFNVFVKGVVSIIVIVGVLLIGLSIYGYFNRIPTTDLHLSHVDRDTTVYIGKATNDARFGGQLSVWVTGNVNDSGAVIKYFYPPESEWATKSIVMPKGKIDTMVTGDFYDERARITYLHKRVRTGHLRIRAVFSYPPEEWPFRSKETGGWQRIKQ